MVCNDSGHFHGYDFCEEVKVASQEVSRAQRKKEAQEVNSGTELFFSKL